MHPHPEEMNEYDGEQFGTLTGTIRMRKLANRRSRLLVTIIAGFAAGIFLRRGGHRAQQAQQGASRACFRESASKRVEAREPGTHQ